MADPDKFTSSQHQGQYIKKITPVHFDLWTNNFLKRDMALYLHPIDQKPLVCPHLDAKEAGNIFIRFIWTLLKTEGNDVRRSLAIFLTLWLVF